MPKYIDSDALKEAFLIEGRDVYDDMYERWGASQELIEKVIDSAPAANVEPVVHGRWIEYEHEGQMAQYCSECGSDPGVIYIYRRCPECGAYMDAKRGREDNDD